MTKILVTAFEPFDGEPINPSLEATRAVANLSFENGQVEVLVLPVARFAAEAALLSRLPDAKPDIVLMLGQASRRARVTPERVAINVDDFPIPDNAGNQPQGEPIVPDGPVGYFSTLPIPAIVAELKKAHIPAAVSNSAGTYLCNRLFYRVMHAIAAENLPIRAGFLHLPYLHEQTLDKVQEYPSLSRETIIEAVRLAVDVCLRERSETETTPETSLRAAYRAFNARDIAAALALMTDDVVWPNGMEGGNVVGHDAVREYWTRQWTMIDPTVEPRHIRQEPDGRYAVEVHQIVKDLAGAVLVDRMLYHVYTLRDALVATMEIVEDTPVTDS